VERKTKPKKPSAVNSPASQREVRRKNHKKPVIKHKVGDDQCHCDPAVGGVGFGCDPAAGSCHH